MKVLATGCFDLVHYGHIAFLKQAARLGSTLDIGLMTDGYIREEKNVSLSTLMKCAPKFFGV